MEAAVAVEDDSHVVLPETGDGEEMEEDADCGGCGSHHCAEEAHSRRRGKAEDHDTQAETNGGGQGAGETETKVGRTWGLFRPISIRFRHGLVQGKSVEGFPCYQVLLTRTLVGQVMQSPAQSFPKSLRRIQSGC